MDSSEALFAETEREESSQGWLATFADLMSLLMCFFVLLLSFSEMDVVKFKQIAGSMKLAFGVQRDIREQDIPKGTSVIASEFSPTLAKPSILDQLRQQTSDNTQPELSSGHDSGDSRGDQTGRNKDAKEDHIRQIEKTLQTALHNEIGLGQFELDNQGQQLIIRIGAKHAFSSGSSFVQPAMQTSLRRIARLLKDIPGRIVVSGHTDNIPVNNELFADNLALSSSRAVSIARILKQSGSLPFVQASGFADSQPLVSNQTSRGRERNRRVEITIKQGRPKQQTLNIEQSEITDG